MRTYAWIFTVAMLLGAAASTHAQGIALNHVGNTYSSFPGYAAPNMGSYYLYSPYSRSAGYTTNYVRPAPMLNYSYPTGYQSVGTATINYRMPGASAYSANNAGYMYGANPYSARGYSYLSSPGYVVSYPTSYVSGYGSGRVRYPAPKSFFRPNYYWR